MNGMMWLVAAWAALSNAPWSTPTHPAPFLATHVKDMTAVALSLGVKLHVHLLENFVRTLQLQHDLAGAVALEPFVGDGGPGDMAAELLQFHTLIGAPQLV